ncbi:hypothetical protein GCM10010918_13950 [Paenibacillus radicis (ex Gao et al. 2016)]|uniref:Uncharacterized protein n=1 Tax=Paenibacillus radicis (ex Gao et al. 2016) TaxID=1737354 RepID=A0A917GYP1_9BACL|nr:hypothetical protein GCM10010918_13950 [Paenibacillus radicis (ex Gao et al. 2016)]
MAIRISRAGGNLFKVYVFGLMCFLVLEFGFIISDIEKAVCFIRYNDILFYEV